MMFWRFCGKSRNQVDSLIAGPRADVKSHVTAGHEATNTRHAQGVPRPGEGCSTSPYRSVIGGLWPFWRLWEWLTMSLGGGVQDCRIAANGGYFDQEENCWLCE